MSRRAGVLQLPISRWAPACLLFLTGAAPADEPRLPGAVVEPPAWLVKDAPFDMAKFFAMPSPEENAAPLYLDAFLEFGPEVASCFSTDVRARADAARARFERVQPLWKAWTDDPASVDRAKLDEVIRDHAEGLRKFDLAQKRPRCVFAIGTTIEAPLPHAQVSREVARVLAFQADLDLDRDDFDAAIGRVERGLRLSRDLRPREVSIGQMVSIAIDATFMLNVVPLLLAHPRLRPEHCDRLIAVLKRHEAEAAEPYATAAMGEYVVGREIIRRFEDKVRVRIGPDGRSFDQPITYGEAFRELTGAISANPGNKPSIVANALVAAASGFGLPNDRKALVGATRELLAASPGLEPERRRAFEAVAAKHIAKESPESTTLMRLTFPDLRMLIRSAGRDSFYLRSAESLLGLRRWALTHGGPAHSLEAACRDAKMPGVPLDPFSGAPLKLATIDGALVVYSVGPDGVDDRALKDSNLARHDVGDILALMPPVARRGR